MLLNMSGRQRKNKNKNEKAVQSHTSPHKILGLASPLTIDHCQYSFKIRLLLSFLRSVSIIYYHLKWHFLTKSLFFQLRSLFYHLLNVKLKLMFSNNSCWQRQEIVFCLQLIQLR